MSELPFHFKILVILGYTFAVGCWCVVVYVGFRLLKELFENLHWRYVYKHRFDRPPTASCYCKDCQFHIDSGTQKNKCTNITWADKYTPDNGFCYEADPRKAKK